MPRIISHALAGAAMLALTTGLVLANTELDPMTALAGRPALGNVMDPMAALIATVKSEAEISTNAEFDGLPDGPGAEETYYQCVACHSTGIIKQQRVTDQRWNELWLWMVEAQGMVEPDADTKAVILAYLKQNFSSER
jgi:hypothetical protein